MSLNGNNGHQNARRPISNWANESALVGESLDPYSYADVFAPAPATIQIETTLARLGAERLLET